MNFRGKLQEGTLDIEAQEVLQESSHRKLICRCVLDM